MAAISQMYNLAKDMYANIGVDTDKVLETLKSINLSLHCWQADDVGGFEYAGASLDGGGLAVTGNYPGKARNIEEMQADMEKVFSLLPGNHRLNLHAIYGQFGERFVDRDAIEPQHYEGWVQWCRANKLKLDFNATLFSHPKAADGFTLSSKDESIRNFWIEHVKRCREISAYMGRELETTSLHNLWIPDGAKDTPVDRFTHRVLLKDSLDAIFKLELPESQMKDAVESKLFGIGSESFVVGSHDFYLGYAIKNKKIICLDNGHFHPTEVVGDKISSVLQFVDEVLLHLTRGVRWDSDHVVTQNDEMLLIAQELVRAKALKRAHIGLDFFDGSINRVGAYVVGARAALKSFLYALLEPHEQLVRLEEGNKLFQRLALLENLKAMPFGVVWDYYCEMMGVPPGNEYVAEIEKYEMDVTNKRG